MSAKQFTVSGGEVIQVAGLPVNVTFPALPTGVNITNVYIDDGSAHHNPGQNFAIPAGTDVDIVFEAGTPIQWQFQIPDVPAGDVEVTGVYVMVNDTRYDAGQTVTVAPGNVVSLHYTTQARDYYSVSVTGVDVVSALLDGIAQTVNNGAVNFTIEKIDDDHAIVITGAQPRELPLTFDDHGSTTISVNGQTVTNDDTVNITDAAHIEAVADPIPVHFQVTGPVEVQIDGRNENSQDFTIEVNEPTEIDIRTAQCRLTITYPDDSYIIDVPQGLTTLCAPHRNWWIFDGWSSQEVGFTTPKQVKTQVDLTGLEAATVVCHYQRCQPWEAPAWWRN